MQGKASHIMVYQDVPAMNRFRHVMYLFFRQGVDAQVTASKSSRGLCPFRIYIAGRRSSGMPCPSRVRRWGSLLSTENGLHDVLQLVDAIAGVDEKKV